MGYVHFTEDQKQRAGSVDLVDFLRLNGERDSFQPEGNGV